MPPLHQGAIPESLGNLTRLKHLGLQSNKLTGNIPESLGNLTKLVGLLLMPNNITGAIPESLGNLQNLKVLTHHFNTHRTPPQGHLCTCPGCRKTGN